MCRIILILYLIYSLNYHHFFWFHSQFYPSLHFCTHVFHRYQRIRLRCQQIRTVGPQHRFHRRALVPDTDRPSDKKILTFAECILHFPRMKHLFSISECNPWWVQSGLAIFQPPFLTFFPEQPLFQWTVWPSTTIMFTFFIYLYFFFDVSQCQFFGHKSPSPNTGGGGGGGSVTSQPLAHPARSPPLVAVHASLGAVADLGLLGRCQRCGGQGLPSNQ